MWKASTTRAVMTAAALAGVLATTAPAKAETCRQFGPVNLVGHGHTHVIARPEGREMCFTIAKSAGIADGRITVLTVRPVRNASADEVDVEVTKERSLRRGTGEHHGADFRAPELLGGAQIFVNADTDRHLTVRVRPRHGRDYRLAVIAHEIDVPQMVTTATFETFLHLFIDATLEEMFGRDRKALLLDERIQSIVLKTFFGLAKGQSAPEIVAGIPVHAALKEMLIGANVPREARIAVMTFVMHGWREVTRNALRAFEWPLPDNERDTSRPIPAAIR